jgi:hypothetical protein
MAKITQSNKAKAIVMLGEGVAPCEVAKEFNLKLNTIAHWNIDPDFKAAVAEVREKSIAEWRAQFSSVVQRQWLWDRYKEIAEGSNKQAAVAALAMLIKLGGFDQPNVTPIQANVKIEFPLIHDEANEQGELPASGLAEEAK